MGRNKGSDTAGSQAGDGNLGEAVAWESEMLGSRSGRGWIGMGRNKESDTVGSHAGDGNLGGAMPWESEMPGSRSGGGWIGMGRNKGSDTAGSHAGDGNLGEAMPWESGTSGSWAGKDDPVVAGPEKGSGTGKGWGHGSRDGSRKEAGSGKGLAEAIRGRLGIGTGDTGTVRQTKDAEGENLGWTDMPGVPSSGQASESMDSCGKTEILCLRKVEPQGKLVYRGSNGCPDIRIDKDIFLVGKNKEQADGIIDAEGISRLHARIYRDGGTYYIEDLNSTNGTTLNEVALEYHEKKELSRDDRIRFGVEEYVFC